jgi:hypothetical protein
MTTRAKIDENLELPDELNLDALRSSASNACRNMDLLEKHNMTLVGGFEDEEDPFAVPLPPPVLRSQSLTAPTKTTASLLQIYDLLQEFGGALNATPDEVRNTVVNKLILELDNPDPKVRLKALELLGTVPGIDLFGNKRGPAGTQKPDSPAKDRLKERLQQLKEGLAGVYDPPDEEETP